MVRIADVFGVTVDQLLNSNQVHDSAELRKEQAQLFEGCTSYEKRTIYEIALAGKKGLLQNQGLQKGWECRLIVIRSKMLRKLTI